MLDNPLESNEYVDGGDQFSRENTQIANNMEFQQNASKTQNKKEVSLETV